MKVARIYLRVSTAEQDLTRQADIEQRAASIVVQCAGTGHQAVIYKSLVIINSTSKGDCITTWVRIWCDVSGSVH